MMTMKMMPMVVEAGLSLRRGVTFSSASGGQQTMDVGGSAPLGVAKARARIMEGADMTGRGL
jgi:hypothetical protein